MAFCKFLFINFLLLTGFSGKNNLHLIAYQMEFKTSQILAKNHAIKLHLAGQLFNASASFAN